MRLHGSKAILLDLTIILSPCSTEIPKYPPFSRVFGTLKSISSESRLSGFDEGEWSTRMLEPSLGGGATVERGVLGLLADPGLATGRLPASAWARGVNRGVNSRERSLKATFNSEPEATKTALLTGEPAAKTISPAFTFAKVARGNKAFKCSLLRPSRAGHCRIMAWNMAIFSALE
jgi:hypothetical protein